MVVGSSENSGSSATNRLVRYESPRPAKSLAAPVLELTRAVRGLAYIGQMRLPLPSVGRSKPPLLRGKIRPDHQSLVCGTWLKPSATTGCCIAGGVVMTAGSNVTDGGYGRWPTGVAWSIGKSEMN